MGLDKFSTTRMSPLRAIRLAKCSISARRLNESRPAETNDGWPVGTPSRSFHRRAGTLVSAQTSVLDARAAGLNLLKHSYCHPPQRAALSRHRESFLHPSTPVLREDRLPVVSRVGLDAAVTSCQACVCSCVITAGGTRSFRASSNLPLVTCESMRSSALGFEVDCAGTARHTPRRCMERFVGTHGFARRWNHT